jgi:hypothetical protein
MIISMTSQRGVLGVGNRKGAEEDGFIRKVCEKLEYLLIKVTKGKDGYS